MPGQEEHPLPDVAEMNFSDSTLVAFESILDMSIEQLMDYLCQDSFQMFVKSLGLDEEYNNDSNDNTAVLVSPDFPGEIATLLKVEDPETQAPTIPKHGEDEVPWQERPKARRSVGRRNRRRKLSSRSRTSEKRKSSMRTTRSRVLDMTTETRAYYKAFPRRSCRIKQTSMFM